MVLKIAINQYLEKSPMEWDLFLPELTFAYNTAISISTGYTPAYLNFGQEFKAPGSLHQEIGNRPDSPLKDRHPRIQEALELPKGVPR